MTMKMEKVLRWVPGLCLSLPLPPSIPPTSLPPGGGLLIRKPQSSLSLASLGDLLAVKAFVRAPMDQEGEVSTLLSDSLRQLQSLSHADSSKAVTADPEKQRVCHSLGL